MTNSVQWITSKIIILFLEFQHNLAFSPSRHSDPLSVLRTCLALSLFLDLHICFSFSLKHSFLCLISLPNLSFLYQIKCCFPQKCCFFYPLNLWKIYCMLRQDPVHFITSTTVKIHSRIETRE